MTGYSHGTGNRLTSDGNYNYTFDNEGNTLTKINISTDVETDYTWDYRNRLTDVKIKNSSGTVTLEDTFTYDIFDRRIGKSVDPDGAGSAAPAQMYTVYNGANAYADYDVVSTGGLGGTGGTMLQLSARYLFGLGMDSLIAKIDSSANLSWYLTDNLGSVRQLVTTSGTVLDAINYDSYGNIAYESNAANGDRFKFTGREWDGEVGQYYYRARYYGPGIGRFLSEDPTGYSAGDANLYRYVRNTPDIAVDPSGLKPGGEGSTVPKKPILPPPKPPRPWINVGSLIHGIWWWVYANSSSTGIYVPEPPPLPGPGGSTSTGKPPSDMVPPKEGGPIGEGRRRPE